MIVTNAMVETMQPGAVIVDVGIDQGGSVETARPTTHARPVYREHGVIHYCVANMPGAYPRTSTIVLTDATLPYLMKLADQGLDVLREDSAFAKGVNVHGGHVCCRAVAEDRICSIAIGPSLILTPERSKWRRVGPGLASNNGAAM